jgi:virginiamycin B lyase
MHDPKERTWKAWKPAGASPRIYAVYVDDRDMVWASDWGANAVLRFDPASQTFTSVALPRDNAAVRQILGRHGEVWLPESGTEHISVVRSA